jgi:adhesin transport system membrane fusion protein
MSKNHETPTPTDSPHLISLRLLQIARTPRIIGRVLFYSFLALPLILLLVPWQQSVSAAGRVIARDPMKRPQIIQATIYGRIDESWVWENKDVKAGDKLLRIVDNDPNLIARLNEELVAKQGKLEAARQKEKLAVSNIRVLEEALEQTVSSYKALVEAASDKFKSKVAERNAATAGEHQSKLNLERQKNLRQQGIVSQLDYEKEQRKYEEDLNKLRSAEAGISAAQNELLSKEAELEKQIRESQAKINVAKGYVQEAAGDVALAEAELASQRVKLARYSAQEIVAPADGRIVRILANLGAESLKEGTPLLEFVPTTNDFAVELFLDGNDVPLVQPREVDGQNKMLEPGDKVRLQFEGWPAVQFVGWPSVAVGTFGGIVTLVDAVPSANGKFRILVSPDPEDLPWPEARFLRQGNQANGWVLLRVVPLGQELWRRLNGFPPVISFDEPGKKSGDKGDAKAKDGGASSAKKSK